MGCLLFVVSVVKTVLKTAWLVLRPFLRFVMRFLVRTGAIFPVFYIGLIEILNRFAVIDEDIYSDNFGLFLTGLSLSLVLTALVWVRRARLRRMR